MKYVELRCDVTVDCVEARGMDLSSYAARNVGVKTEDMTCGAVQLATIRLACAGVSPVKATTSAGQVTVILRETEPSLTGLLRDDDDDERPASDRSWKSDRRRRDCDCSHVLFTAPTIAR